MEPRRATSLVLRLYPSGESDLFLDLFTSELGRVRALAKGAKRSQKRFFGILITANLLQVELAPLKGNSDLWRLQSASLLSAFPGLGADFRRWVAAGPLLEILLRATAIHDPHPQALSLALATLSRLESANEARDMAAGEMVFLLRLLGMLGYGLNLQSCISCERPFSPAGSAVLSLAGGLICPQCRQGRREMEVPPGLIKGLSAAATLDLEALRRLTFPLASLRPGLNFLHRFWQEIAGHDLLSLDLLRRLLL